MANPGVRIGLIGDYDPAQVVAHRAIPRALALASDEMGIDVACEWTPTEQIADASRVAGFDGIWCVPGSPYRDTEGALRAIQFAREKGRPFLGTCGGFQHAVLEYAIHVLNWKDASHAESHPGGARPVISLLECSLLEVTDRIRFRPGSRIAAAYGAPEAAETYRCRYGLNAEFREQLLAGPLRVSAQDDAGEIRAIELEGHPFFVATLFQPERAALIGNLPPLARAFVTQAASK
jgi:CTP synthase (UTP-ammonia lyase)